MVRATGTPPVDEIQLGVYFQTVHTMQSLTLASLRLAWIDEYPKLSEVTPRRPWQDDDDTVELVASGGAWPMPLCVLTSADGLRVVEIQNDRFTVAWSFDTSTAYPGFSALSAEFLRMYAELESTIRDVISSELSAGRVSLSFVSPVGRLSATQLGLGILGGWQVAKTQARQADYAGIRIHYCSEDDNDTGVLVAVDPARKSDVEDDQPGAILRIETSRFVESNKGLTDCFTLIHNAAMRSFMDLSSEEMRAEWNHDTN